MEAVVSVTLHDVQDYWKYFCQRNDVPHELLWKGQLLIAMDHQYWADHPMRKLKERAVFEIQKEREAEAV